MPPVRALALTAALATAAAAAPAVAAAPASVAPALKGTLTKLKAETTLPVYLPSTFPVERYGKRPLYPVVSTTKTSWGVDLGLVPDCNGANVCSTGFLGAVKTARPLTNADGRYKVTLHGTTGRYRPLSCGASCSPPSITFRAGGVNTTFQLKLVLKKGETDRQVLTRLANQALDAGPR